MKNKTETFSISDQINIFNSLVYKDTPPIQILNKLFNLTDINEWKMFFCLYLKELLDSIQLSKIINNKKI